MSVPTSYTETTLKEYMHAVIGNMASALSFTVAGGSYDEALNDALFGYGQTDITQVSGSDNIQLLRAYARYYAWRLVAFNTAGEFDYTHADSGATYKRSQMHKQAKDMMQEALTDIEALGGDVVGYSVSVYGVQYTDDLYTADAVGDTDNEWGRLS